MKKYHWSSSFSSDKFRALQLVMEVNIASLLDLHISLLLIVKSETKFYRSYTELSLTNI